MLHIPETHQPTPYFAVCKCVFSVTTEGFVTFLFMLWTEVKLLEERLFETGTSILIPPPPDAESLLYWRLQIYNIYNTILL
jgi:hypothetical protein